MGKVCVFDTDLYDIGSHCGIFVIPCGAYLCVAVAFGGTVPGRMTLWVTYVVNDVTMTLSMLAGFYHGICDLNLLLGSNHTRDWYMEQWGQEHCSLVWNLILYLLFCSTELCHGQ